MTAVTVFYKSGRVTGFCASGHSGYAKRGEDIVCAGVSALTQSACMGIEQLVDSNVDISLKDGELRLMLAEASDEEQRRRAELILGTMLLGLRSIEQKYSDYLKLYEREV